MSSSEISPVLIATLINFIALGTSSAHNIISLPAINAFTSNSPGSYKSLTAFIFNPSVNFNPPKPISSVSKPLTTFSESEIGVFSLLSNDGINK